MGIRTQTSFRDVPSPPSSAIVLPDRAREAHAPAELEILLVEDHDDTRASIEFLLAESGHRVVGVGDGGAALSLIRERVFDAAIFDIHLPSVDGLTLLSHVRRDSPGTVVILMTGYAAVDEAVKSLHAGALEYLTKPVHPEALARSVQRIAERIGLRRELDAVREDLAGRDAGSVIVGTSPLMKQLSGKVDTVARSNAPVVILGESGTGKELVARTIHARSPRRDQPFIAVNCAAFPEGLLEAELFGHERGAFTGAVRRREGRFMAAHRGTLLLDEAGEIPLPAQVKLLRVLEQGTIEPLGSNDSVPVDVRVLAATHRNLKSLVASGAFREDLYFRLNVLELTIPPLRERRSDLVVLLAHFLEKLTPSGKVPPGLSPRAWAALTQYAYPGNVREFAHAIERSLVLSHGDEIDLEHLPEEIAGAITPTEPTATTFRPLHNALWEFEREYVLRALRHAAGGRAQAAHLLGISRKNLWEKIRKHHISDSDMELSDALDRQT
jgi:DNA-binding NtrC family response regulator